jgi:hypothetical protein
MKRRFGVMGLGLLVGAAACKRSAPAAAVAGGHQIVVANVGLATPESMLLDPLEDVYLISNINGVPDAADDNGFITRMSPDGTIIALKWIDGASNAVTLNAPKGMAVSGPYIYVTDINTIRRFDRRTGAPGGDIPVPGATFLNDIAPGEDGSLYFTDSGLKGGAKGLEPSGTDAVYRLHPDGKLDTLARGDSLGHPNGVAVTGDSVYVVGYGSGEIYRLANGQRQNIEKAPKGGLDGLVIFGGERFISSWDGQAIFRGRLDSTLTEFVGRLEAPADIGHDMWRNRLLVPLFNRNEVRIIPLAF